MPMSAMHAVALPTMYMLRYDIEITLFFGWRRIMLMKDFIKDFTYQIIPLND